MADPRQPPEPDPFRMAVESNTPGWEGPRRTRPPIWVDRPRGSFAAAVALAVLACASAFLALYDVGIIWPPEPQDTDGLVTLVAPSGFSSDRVTVAVAYAGDETIIVVPLEEYVRPRQGERVIVATHVRYFRRHLSRVVRPDDDRTLLYQEPEHTLSVNGLLGVAGTLTFGGLAWTQLRLAQAQDSREILWREPHPDAE